jgi:hypothetical protein
MNALTDLDAETGMASSAGAEPHLHTLRRTGRKAVRFSGWQIVEALGSSGSAPVPGTIWYDLAIYRSAADSIIVELIARRGELDEQDIHHVEIFATLLEAASWLENYACAQDVPIPAMLAETDGPMAVSILQAVQLRQRIARIRDDYQGLLSEVFEALDITDAETHATSQHHADAA